MKITYFEGELPNYRGRVYFCGCNIPSQQKKQDTTSLNEEKENEKIEKYKNQFPNTASVSTVENSDPLSAIMQSKDDFYKQDMTQTTLDHAAYNVMENLRLCQQSRKSKNSHSALSKMSGTRLNRKCWHCGSVSLIVVNYRFAACHACLKYSYIPYL